jgi:hypothetical protein
VQVGCQEGQQRKHGVEYVNYNQTTWVMHRIDYQMCERGAASDKCADVRDPLPPGYLRICGDYADGGKTLKPARHRQAMLRLTANKFTQSRHLTIYKVDFANWALVQSYATDPAV